MRRIGRVAILLALAGCVPEVVKDDHPKHATAVVRTYFHNLGFKGMFASESTRSVYTRASMRRSEDQFKFTGFLMKRLAKGHDDAVIWRVDKNLQWRLNTPEKTYVECPLLGCVSRAKRAAAPERPQRPPEEKPERKPSCPLTLAKHQFTVKATGESRSINGFETTGYKVQWLVVVQDKNKKKDTSTVTIDLWTAPESDPRLAAVRGVESRFEAAMRSRLPEPAGLKKVVPAEAMNILAMQFMNGLTQDQRAAVTNVGAEMSKVHGHPISTSLEWRLEGDACETAARPEKRTEPPSALDFSHGVRGFLGSAGGSAAKKGVESKTAEMEGKPVFAFVEEVQEMKVAEASDGLFLPPADFKKTSP